VGVRECAGVLGGTEIGVLHESGHDLNLCGTGDDGAVTPEREHPSTASNGNPVDTVEANP
jgi:hypothetical protein